MDLEGGNLAWGTIKAFAQEEDWAKPCKSGHINTSTKTQTKYLLNSPKY
jgi:hypothetical protein